MKLLVTGGAGFIGSNFIRYILTHHQSYEIINFDKLTYAGNPENLRGVESNSNYSFIKGDICNAKDVESAINGVDAIVNFAAESHVDRSIVSAGSFVQTDVYGTYVLLEAVKKHKIARFLHISTDEVYGSAERGSFSEKDALSPNSPYAASKAGADLLVRSYFKTYSLPVVITRSSNNYGPYQYPEKFIPLFVTNAIENDKLPLYGDGKNVRDWLYVLDNCEAIDLVLHKGREGEVYNIGGKNEKQNIEIVKSILSELKKPESLIEHVKDRPGHDRRYSLNIGKIKKELMWEPKADFKQALKETIKWYVDNCDWWKKIKEKQAEFKQFYSSWYKNQP